MSNLNYKNGYVVCPKTKHNIVTQSNGNLCFSDLVANLYEFK